MLKLAPLKLASPNLARTSTRLPGHLVHGFGAIQIKAPPARQGDLVDTFGLPEPLMIAKLDWLEALWMGPAEWLAIASRDHLAALTAFESLLAKSEVAAVRCDSRLAILELEITAEILSGLTGLPLRAIAPGRVARTRLADLPVTIASGAEGTSRLLFDRCYASHMYAWLDRAT